MKIIPLKLKIMKDLKEMFKLLKEYWDEDRADFIKTTAILIGWAIMFYLLMVLVSILQ